MIIFSPENRKFQLVNRNVKPKEQNIYHKYTSHIHQSQVKEQCQNMDYVFEIFPFSWLFFG